MLRIVLATANPHKLEELRAIFAELLPPTKIQLTGLDTYASKIALKEPAETGSSFEQNATIKAISYAQQTQQVCLADDSGLEIDALSGKPGVISSHYSSDGREIGLTRAQRDAANNARVLAELRGTPPARRNARFVCVMVLATPASGHSRDSGLPKSFSGVFEGRIGLPHDEPHADTHATHARKPDPALIVPRGTNGFGYDPLFLVAPDFKQTSAELSPDEKNRLSHRAAAARAAATWIAQHRDPLALLRGGA
jgi:XTP/dITP diphosphohydrolase